MTNGYEIKDSHKHREFSTGANRDSKIGKGRFDLVPPATLRALAIHYEKGARKYADRNWEKGIPIGEFIDSGLRHINQFLDGQDDENHLIAGLWNIFCAYETILRIQNGRLPKELYNLPFKVVLSDPYAKEEKKET
jgi:hypothetical protein